MSTDCTKASPAENVQDRWREHLASAPPEPQCGCGARPSRDPVRRRRDQRRLLRHRARPAGRGPAVGFRCGRRVRG